MAKHKKKAASQCEDPSAGDWYRAEDIDSLTRDLDVLLNGPDGAARQAGLCDIVAQVQREGVTTRADLDAVRVCIQAADEYVKALHDFRNLGLDVAHSYRIAAATKLQERGRLYEAARRRVLEQVLTPRT